VHVVVREGAEGLQRENAEGGKKKREGGRSRVAYIRMRGVSSSHKQQQRRRHTSASTAAVAVAAFLRTISCLATFGENITICPLMAHFSQILAALSYLAGRAWVGVRIVLRELWVLFVTWIKVSKAM
jgi:hypothetical protein